MNELDELKSVMDAPPDFEPVWLDLDHVMTAGGRMRRRRRVAVSAASGAAVAVLLVGGGLLTNLPGPGAPEVTGAVAGPTPSAINSSAPGILGTVVNTGRRLDGQQWIIYAETVDPDNLNGNLTLVLGRTKTGYINDFTKDIVSSDTDDRRMAPGFHAVRAGTVIAGRTTPTFGYYAGDPARITARDTRTGKTVDAHLTAWTGFGAHEKAQIFWFDFAQGADPVPLTELTAYDRHGKKLP